MALKCEVYLFVYRLLIKILGQIGQFITLRAEILYVGLSGSLKSPGLGLLFYFVKEKNILSESIYLRDLAVPSFLSNGRGCTKSPIHYIKLAVSMDTSIWRNSTCVAVGNPDLAGFRSQNTNMESLNFGSQLQRVLYTEEQRRCTRNYWYKCKMIR